MLQQDLNINRKIYMRKRNKLTNFRTCSTKIQNVLFRTIFQIVCVYYEAIRKTEAKHIINYTKQRNNKLQKIINLISHLRPLHYIKLIKFYEKSTIK